MNEKRRRFLAVTVLLALVVSGTASAEIQHTDVILHFWKARSTDQTTLEEVDLLIPRVVKNCPAGFIPAGKQYCGREITVEVTLYIGGEDYGAKELTMQYRQAPSGYFQTFVPVITTAHLRNMTVLPFLDKMGVRHEVVGTLWLRTEDGESFEVVRRRAEHPFLIETRDHLPFARHVECQSAASTTHAALNGM